MPKRYVIYMWSIINVTIRDNILLKNKYDTWTSRIGNLLLIDKGITDILSTTWSVRTGSDILSCAATAVGAGSGKQDEKLISDQPYIQLIRFFNASPMCYRTVLCRANKSLLYMRACPANRLLFVSDSVNYLDRRYR